MLFMVPIDNVDIERHLHGILYEYDIKNELVTKIATAIFQAGRISGHLIMKPEDPGTCFPSLRCCFN